MGFLNRLSIARRLTLGFTLMVLLMAVLGGLSLWQVRGIGAEVHTVTDDLLPKQQRLQTIKGEVNEIARAMRNMMIMDAPDDIQKQRQEIDASRVVIKDSLQWLEERIANPEAKTLLAQMLAAREAFVQSQEKFFGALGSGLREDARRVLLGETREKQLAYMEQIEKLIAFQDQLTSAGGRRVDATVGTVMQVTAGVLAAGVLVALLLAVSIIRSVTRPIAQAVEIAHHIASGDLTQKIVVTGRDETGRLMAAMQTMQDALGAVVSSVRQGAEGVATASAQIAQGNQDLSSRTEQQASALEETSASMEEMGSTAQQNADNARAASQLALSASTVAQQGGEVVGQVVSTMREIQHSSQKINDIIGVIDGIAFQTNILALNAAVEAARAGEQGRGFAVVAGEVRTLAQRSAEAAKEIKQLINASVERVEQGTTLVDQAGSTMQEVVQSIQRVTDIVGEISSASQEQNAGVSQVSEAVSNMDQATQQNAALVEESASAATSLQQQADQLLKAVSVFRIAGASASSSLPVRAATPVPPSAHRPVPAKAPSAPARPAPVARAAAPAPAPKATRAAAPVAAPAAPKAVVASGGGASDDWESF